MTIKKAHRILVIEDEKILRENIADILGHYGFDVTTAVNGEEGIESAMKQKPDAVVCDIMLPGMDGYDVLKSFNSNQQLSGAAFVFLTAKSTRSDTRAGMDLGADDYITKPFTKEELINSLNTRLSKKQGAFRSSIVAEDDGFKTAYQLLEQLTKTEKKVIAHIAEGLTTRQIAEKLFVSYKTIENHRSNISEKLKLHGPNSLINFVYRLKGKSILQEGV